MDQNKVKIKPLRSRTGLSSETIVIVKLPDAKTLRVVSRSVFLALVFIAFPCISPLAKKDLISAEENKPGFGFDSEQFFSLLRGLAEEGLLRQTDRAAIVFPGLKNPRAYGRHTVVDQSTPKDETFDLVYAGNLARDAELVGRLVKKPSGIVAFPLRDADTPIEGIMSLEYKIVYLRRYSTKTTIVAMKRIGEESSAKGQPKRRLLVHSAPEEALEELEEPLLEPPRQRSRSSTRKIKFLPEILGDGSLGGFGRRVFVNASPAEDQRRDAARWFEDEYPKMKQDFEVYDVAGEASVSLSEWVTRNVREEDYVVLKAEAEAVEEMVGHGTIRLVNELFLECNNEWWRVGKNRKIKTKRAYWECLALYGRVKDQGVAVHQWWG